MANPNLLEATSCTLGSIAVIPSTSTTDVTNAVAADTIRKVVSLYACNVSASSQTLELWYYNPGISRRIVHDLTIPANATVVIITKEAPLHLFETYDKLQAIASSLNTIHLYGAFEDYS